MRLLLIALVWMMTMGSAFEWDPGPAPGLKLKNAILYVLFLGLLLRASMDRNFRVQLPQIPIAFIVLIGYAILTYLAIILIIQYPHYRVLGNAFDLKGFVDQLLFFLVFFYGVREEREAIFVLKCLMFAFTLTHAMAVLDAVGLVQIGDITQRTDGRVEGFVGESNQYGAFVALTLPATLALVLITRGAQRWFWAVAALLSAVTLLMTGSRGALVASIGACVAAAFLLRAYVPRARLAKAAALVVVGFVVVFALTIALGFGGLFFERIADSMRNDMVSNSSGRTEIWSTAINVMFDKPVTLLTGYGWRSYATFPFRYAPHNYYLNQWFNLGLIGLGCALVLFALPLKTARAALPLASAQARPILMAGVIAILAYAFATFFVDIYSPWLYFWAYVGLLMRISMGAATEAVVERAPAAPPRRADPYGWTREPASQPSRTARA